MYHSLTVDKNLLDEMDAVFAASPQEEGFLLGFQSRLDHLNQAIYLPASDAGLHYYTPDPVFANQQINAWTNDGICFCGFVHSHIVNKPTLSDADKEYARSIFQVYHLPVLWFGIGIVQGQKVDYHFYAVTAQNGKISISSVVLKTST